MFVLAAHPLLVFNTIIALFYMASQALSQNNTSTSEVDGWWGQRRFSKSFQSDMEKATEGQLRRHCCQQRQNCVDRLIQSTMSQEKAKASRSTWGQELKSFANKKLDLAPEPAERFVGKWQDHFIFPCQSTWPQKYGDPLQWVMQHRSWNDVSLLKCKFLDPI